MKLGCFVTEKWNSLAIGFVESLASFSTSTLVFMWVSLLRFSHHLFLERGQYAPKSIQRQPCKGGFMLRKFTEDMTLTLCFRKSCDPIDDT